MNYVDSYFEKAMELLKIVREEEKGNVVKAAEVFADTIKKTYTFLRYRPYPEYGHRRFQQGW